MADEFVQDILRGRVRQTGQQPSLRMRRGDLGRDKVQWRALTMPSVIRHRVEETSKTIEPLVMRTNKERRELAPD